jgi:hypothetical protein
MDDDVGAYMDDGMAATWTVTWVLPGWWRGCYLDDDTTAMDGDVAGDLAIDNVKVAWFFFNQQNQPTKFYIPNLCKIKSARQISTIFHLNSLNSKQLETNL